MKVVTNFEHNYQDDPIRHFQFEEFEDVANDCILFVGAHPHPSITEPADVPKYFFSTEEQSWAQDGTNQYVPYVNEIFTICPPNVTGREKRRAAFFPLNAKDIPLNVEKKYDVIYTGFAGGSHISRLLDVIKNFNYRLVSFSSHGGLTTDLNASYKDKLSLIAQSKLCITHNQTGTGTPQLKSRIFEAAFCRSLMLVLRDEYNIVEEWFTPGVDFIYYDMDNLEQTIQACLQEPEACQTIINNAFNKAIMNYTTMNFVEKYIGFKQ